MGAGPAGGAAGDITTFTDPAGNVDGPSGIAPGPDGALWFTNSNNNRIGRITTAGVITTFTDPAGNVNSPVEIAAGPDGALWFTSNANNRIGRITTAGMITTFSDPAGNINGPHGIAAGPDGALWFTSQGNGRVGRITTTGVITTFTDPAGNVSVPAGITTGPDGALWFTNTGNHRIGRITTAGMITTFSDPAGNISGPYRIAVGPDGALWFTNTGNDRIGRITTAGVITTFTDPAGNVSVPSGITAGPDGALWFTSNANNRIGRITTAGVITTFTDPAGNVSGPSGIAPGLDGALWFASFHNDRIGRIESGVEVPPPEGARFLVIDDDSIDNGNPPNFFSAAEVNDDIATLALRSELPFFDANPGDTITLHTGQVGDEGWFAPKTIRDSWAAAGPTPDGLRNYLGNPSQPYPHNVGPGLGTGPDPEALLDKVPDVAPLRATGLKALEGQRVCAVVYDSDVSMNYGPLNGTLKGTNLGVVALEVVSVTELTGFSSSSLPQVEVEILDADEVCEGPVALFDEAPEPQSSSDPYDTTP